MDENIDDIRRKAIIEIKEKVRKNPKFLHPANKERLEYQEKLKFGAGINFTYWMQQNEIMANPTDIDSKEAKKRIKDIGCNGWKDYKDKCARSLGFRDFNERRQEWRYETGRQLPKEFNEDCSTHFGEFTEDLMIQTFENPIKMPPNNPGFDWVCNKGYKIDNKGVCLVHSERGSPRWIFTIRWNNIADWFVLSAWDNRDSLNPLHVWAFYKGDIVRDTKFWRRDSFTITNVPECLKEFEKYEITDRLNKLKELCEGINK